MADIVLDVQRRDRTGKNEARRLRRSGLVPAILYGDAQAPVAVAVEPRALHAILHSPKGLNTIFDLGLAETDQRPAARVIAFQTDPVTDALSHVDFVRVVADVEIHVRVHVELKGTPVGVRTEGGILEFVLREVEVSCLPKDIPDALALDVTDLALGHVLRVKDLHLPPGVKCAIEADRVVCAVHAPKAEEIPTPAAAVEGEVPAEGAPAAAAAEGAEAKEGAGPARPGEAAATAKGKEAAVPAKGKDAAAPPKAPGKDRK